MPEDQDRYDKSGCAICHGAPPAGFTCMKCLSSTWHDELGERPRLVGQFGDIEVGDTDELDWAWDRLSELGLNASYQLSFVGISPYVISQLFRVAIDATKEAIREQGTPA